MEKIWDWEGMEEREGEQNRRWRDNPTVANPEWLCNVM